MFEVLFALFVIVFVLVLVSIVVGTIRAMSLSGKIFQAVERQLDEQLSRPKDDSSDNSNRRPCAHCGTAATSGEKCPSCGANVG